MGSPERRKVGGKRKERKWRKEGGKEKETVRSPGGQRGGNKI